MKRISFSCKLFLLFGLISSCGKSGNGDTQLFKSENGDTIFARTFYEDGSLREEQMFNADTVPNGVFVSYYQNGKVKYENFFIDGKENGIARGFFENGEPRYLGKVEDGKKDSTWLWYEQKPDGLHLNMIENYLNGKLFGGQLKFNKNGHFEWYKFYSLDGLLGKVSFEGSESVVEGELGNIYYDQDELDIGEGFYSKIYPGVPPGWQSRLNVKILDKNGDLLETESGDLRKTEERNTDAYHFSFESKEQGTYSVKYSMHVMDEKGAIEYSDTLAISLSVKEKH